MKLDEYIETIISNKNSERETSTSSFELIEEAISQFPQSSKLYCLKGDAIQLGCEALAVKLSDALLSYEKAIELNPSSAEAYESIGYYFDVVFEDFSKAEIAFRKAIEIEPREDSYAGLARVLAQQGNPIETTIELLKKSPFSENERILEIRNEIESGLWEAYPDATGQRR